MSELDVLIEGKLIGRVRMNKAGRLSFDYEPRWRDSPRGYSLSVSMPLANITYSHNLVSPYLWNLLPENPNILAATGLHRGYVRLELNGKRAQADLVAMETVRETHSGARVLRSFVIEDGRKGLQSA